MRAIVSVLARPGTAARAQDANRVPNGIGAQLEASQAGGLTSAPDAAA